MRRIAYIFLGLALIGAATWFCSSDAPAPTPPKTVSPIPGGASALQIRLFTSNANPVAGACTVLQAVVTLNGVNVPDGTGVAFTTDLSSSFFQQNGLPLVSVVTQGGTTTTDLCSNVAGLATVRATATIGSETGAATIQIAFQPSPQVAPFFTFCAPSFGPPEGGTSLTINGGRFFGDTTTTRATFTAAGITREALVTAVTTTSVTLVTPAFPEASSPSVPVSITVVFGTKSTTPATLSLPNCFAFGTATPSTPSITAVLPSSGSNDGNTRVTIIGSGFVAPLQVFFGPVEAQVLSISFNQIIVLTPPASGAGLPNLNASVTVRVHEINSGLDASLANGFRFVTKLQITAIDNNLQRVDQAFAPVTIHGQGFLSPVAVTLAGLSAKVISVSATELLVLPTTPFLTGCADVSGAVVVTNIDSGDTVTGLSFTYQVAITKPIITSVTPAVGGPGTTVTISGTNLGNITNVTFGSRPASIVSVSNGSVVVTVPDNGATAPACPAGTPTGTPLNVGTPVDVTVTSALTTCTTTAAGSFQYQLPCKPGADLSIAKTASPSPVVTGSTLTYSISVNNNGPNTATNVVVQDFLPGSANFVFISCTASQGTCSAGGNNVVTANLGDLASPGFASVTITGTVTAPGDSTITNTAVVSSSTPDTNTANNTASVTTTVNASLVSPTPTFPVGPTPTPTPVPADLALTKTASPEPVVSGSTLTYRLLVSNNGPGTSNGVVVTDPLPVGTTFLSCTVSQGNCLGPAVGSNGTVIANPGSIPSPGFAVVTIVVTVTAPGGITLTNTAFVTAVTPDPSPANNTATATSTVSPAPGGADLSVVKNSSAATVPSGSNLTYTVTVHNGGPDLATGVIMTDALPTGTTFVSCTPSQGTCTGPVVGSNGTVTANLGTMPSGSTAVVTIVVNVTASGGSTLVNTAVVSSAVTDPNPANNSSTNVTQVSPPPTPVPSADLSISKGSSPNPVVSGDNLTYTLQVANLGPSPSNGVVVSDPLPAGTLFLSCGTSQGACAFAAGTVTANLGTIGPSGAATLTILVRVTECCTVLSNTGSVSASTPDPDLSNNSSTTLTTVNPPTPTPTITPTNTPTPTPTP
jgi:uncharacterized repeat protein (TIGR01451 family)